VVTALRYLYSRFAIEMSQNCDVHATLFQLPRPIVPSRQSGAIPGRRRSAFIEDVFYRYAHRPGVFGDNGH